MTITRKITTALSEIAFEAVTIETGTVETAETTETVETAETRETLVAISIGLRNSPRLPPLHTVITEIPTTPLPSLLPLRHETTETHEIT